MKTQGFQVQPLRGIDQRWSADPSSANRIEDMSWYEMDSWRECGGMNYIVSTAAAQTQMQTDGGVDSLHWFAQHNGARQWLIWTTPGGKFRYLNAPSFGSGLVGSLKDTEDNLYNGVAKSLTTITNAPWPGMQSVTWGGRMYFFNGYDPPLVFNGRYLDRAGFDSPPGQPTVSTLENTTLEWGTGVSGLGLGRLADSGSIECAYRWKVSFVNERGQESPLSGPSETAIIENTTGRRSGAYVEVPTGGSNVVARRIYRTRNMYNSSGEPIDLGFGEDYYFLIEIQDNVTDYFEDWFPDTNLGALADEIDFGELPTATNRAAAFKNTMFIAGTSDNLVRYSAPLFPEVFPADNLIDVGDDDGGLIIALRATKNALVVLKQRSIYLIKGNPSTGFFAEILTADAGCIAPNSVAELPGLGLVFLSSYGVHLLVGALENTGTPTKVVNLTEGIPKFVERINRAAAIAAHGVVYHKDKEYLLSLPTLGSSVNDTILVYHYEVGAWSTRTGFDVQRMVESRDHRGYLFMGSSASSKEGVHVYSRGWGDKVVDPIAPLYQTADMDFGSVYKATQPKYAIPYAIGHGDNNIEINYTVNQSIDSVRASVQTADQQDPNERFDVYDTAVWGTARWAQLRPVAIRFDISATDQGPVRELSLTFTAESSRLQLLGYNIEAAVGEQRLIKPLNEALAPDKG